MIYLRPLQVLCYSCFLVVIPGGVFAESCKVSQTEKKNGYIVFDQTKLSEQGKARLVNHAVSVMSAIMSTVKLVKPRCILPTYVPSYYLYNGANLVDGVANLASLVTHKEESRQELVAYVGEGDTASNQIAAFDQAYAQQMKAYQAAKRRERILKATGMARKGAVAVAGVEWVITKRPDQSLQFICFNSPEAATAAKTAIDKAAEAKATVAVAAKATAAAAVKAAVKADAALINSHSQAIMAAEVEAVWAVAVAAKAAAAVAAAETAAAAAKVALTEAVYDYDNDTKITKHFALGRNISGTVINSIAKAITKGAMEQTPKNRMILYGAQEILAMAISKDTNNVSRCMKQRADEFKTIASALRQRLGSPNTTGGGDGTPPTGEVNLPATSPPNSEEFSRRDFAGCMVQTKSVILSDPQCTCAQNNSCYQIPKLSLSTAQAKGIPTHLPSSLLSNLRNSRDFLNKAFSGNSSGANLAAIGSGQGAAKLDRQIAAIKKQINRMLKKQGKRPINFDAKSRRLANNIRQAVGQALSKSGIKSIGQFNKAVGQALSKSGIKSIGQFNKAVGQALLKDQKFIPKAKLTESIANTSTPKLGPSKSSHGNDRNGANFDFLNDGEKTSESASIDSTDTADGDTYHVAKDSDILNSTQDIFEALSYRYMKSGYPRLLNAVKKKGPTPAGKAARGPEKH